VRLVGELDDITPTTSTSLMSTDYPSDIFARYLCVCLTTVYIGMNMLKSSGGAIVTSQTFVTKTLYSVLENGDLYHTKSDFPGEGPNKKDDKKVYSEGKP
jgi:hypothetical protein